MKITLRGTAETREVSMNGEILSPERSQKHHNHSPDGFSWGYLGSGPSQLALAVLIELTDAATAHKNYMEFKSDIIASLPFGEDFCEVIDMSKYLSHDGK